MEVIYVYGSNKAGKLLTPSHFVARDKYKAEEGVGIGRTGNAYAIPVRDHKFRLMPLCLIERFTYQFIIYARYKPELKFEVAFLGCDKDEHSVDDVGELFKETPKNVILPLRWQHE
jgi:hypothetical protein